jgi:hypothetical protein
LELEKNLLTQKGHLKGDELAGEWRHNADMPNVMGNPVSNQ